jgi:hypothetical protein
VSTFYVLPPRPLLGEYFADYLRPVFPELDWASADRIELVRLLEAAAIRHTDVFVVYREELPDDEEIIRALTDGFGAEPGDQIIEVRSGAKPGAWTARKLFVGPFPPLAA